MAMLRLEHRSNADRLRDQADALQSRAFELRREAEDLLAEALELRNDADRWERDLVRPGLRVAAASRVREGIDAQAEGRQAALSRKVLDVLASGPKSANTIAEHLALSPIRVRSILAALVDAGQVERFGKTRSTRYTLAIPEEPEPAPVAPPEPEHASLRVFTKQLTARELEDRRLAWTTEAPAVLPNGAVPEPVES